MKAFTLAIVLLGATTCAIAAGLRSDIEAMDKSVAAAMKKKDFAAVNKLIKGGTTSDFKYIEAGKPQTLDQMLQNMKMGIGMMDKMSVCEAGLVTLKEKGNTAVATTHHKMVGTMKGEDKKVHKMTFDGVSEDTYVKQNGKWKMSSMTWKSQKQTMDGKAVPAMGG